MFHLIHLKDLENTNGKFQTFPEPSEMSLQQ